MCKLESLLTSSNIRLLQLHDDDDDDDDNYNMASSDMSVSGAEPSSACLWAMVHDFLEAEPAVACTSSEDQIKSNAGTFLSGSYSANSYDTILKRAIQEVESIFGEGSAQDTPEAKIASCVATALNFRSGMVGLESVHNAQALPGVLKHLQREGYDAGLCVIARKPGNVTAFPPPGGHMYIDVILEESPASGTPEVAKRSSDKMIVDVGFPAHFEIARPLPAYQKLIALLPPTFVGKASVLQRVVHIMSQAARASLESQDMLIPPWRSFTFLLAKWWSPSCSRITSIDKAKHVVLHASLSNHVTPRVLAELDNNTDLANIAESPVSTDSEDWPKSFILRKDGAQSWYPPPPINQFIVNDDESDPNPNSYTMKRRQANAVSALALAFMETQHAHMRVAAKGKACSTRPPLSAAVVNVL